jgi:hypothetical protein
LSISAARSTVDQAVSHSFTLEPWTDLNTGREGRIDIDAEGHHTLTLDYELD